VFLKNLSIKLYGIARDLYLIVILLKLIIHKLLILTYCLLSYNIVVSLQMYSYVYRVLCIKWPFVIVKAWLRRIVRIVKVLLILV
jgi:hypothetical protein